jgi:type I restriction enzyme, S subunit
LTQIIERTDKQTTLPESWLVCKLADLAEFSKDKAAPDKLDANTRYIGLEHIEKNTGSLLGYGTSAEVRSTKSRFNEGELLYGKLRPYLNKVHVAEFEGICSTDILVLRTLGGVQVKYLHYRLLSKDFVEYANKNVSGVQHPRVNAKTVSQFDVELPPSTSSVASWRRSRNCSQSWTRVSGP